MISKGSATRLITIVLLGMVLVLALAQFPAISGFVNRNSNASVDAIQQSVQDAAVQAFALEGSYPPDIDYLVKHYGIVLDDRFYYFYTAMAANVPPDIRVVAK